MKIDLWKAAVLAMIGLIAGMLGYLKGKGG